MGKRKVCLDYESLKEDLHSIQDALGFIVHADESDAGGFSRVSGLAYAKVAEAGLTHCNQVIERLEKAAEAEEGRD